jgi:hypothetical protein
MPLIKFANTKLGRSALAAVCLMLPLIAQAVTYANTAYPFNWVDSSTQTVLDSSTVTNPGFSNTGGCGTTQPTIDDTLSGPLNIGFNFIYGGVAFNTVRVMSNGRLQFNNNTTCGFGSPVTQLPYPDATLLYTMRIYGNDLDPTLNGAGGYVSPNCPSRASCYVSYGQYGVAPYRSFVVTWFGVPEWTNGAAPSGSYNLQVILQENGEFIYQYGLDTPGPANTNAQIGWEIDTNDYSVPVLGFPASHSAIKFYIPQPVAEYRMEQPAWTGVAGEVKDTSGKGNNASLVTAGGAARPATVANAPGYICRGADFTPGVNATTAGISAIDSGVNVSTAVGSSGTITFWYKPVSAASWNGNGTSVEAMLFDGTISANNYFYLQKTKLSATTSGLRFVIRDSSGTTRTVTTAALALNANNALHIGVSWTFNNTALANNDHIRIYANGVQVAQLLITSTVLTISPSLGSLYIGDNRSAITDPGATNYGNSANGVIDEFRIYNYEGALALIQRDMGQANVCLDHYAISHAGTGTTCNPTQVTIFAHDSAHGNVTMPNNTTTINLSTSTGKGDWSVISGYGTLNNGVANDGNATYLWNGEYQAVLALTHTTAGTVNVNVSDGQLTEFKTPPPNEDPDLTLSNVCTNALSFLVSAPSTGSTCAGAVVTVSAKDAAAGGGNVVTTYTGTVILSTSNGHGSWSKVPGQANGTLSSTAAGTQYTFAAADNGVARFTLLDLAAETLTATATDAVVPAVKGTSGNITYGGYSFQVVTNDTMGGTVAANASTIPVAGRNHALKISLFNGCVVDAGYTGNKNLDIWYNPTGLHPAGANAPTVLPAASGALPTTAPASLPASNNWLTVPFAAGVANFTLVTSDVGQYSIGIRDDTRTYVPVGASDVAGTSPILTVRPFGLFASVTGNTGTGSGVVSNFKAGNNFSATVSAVDWQAADDANNDGVPDAGADLSNNAITTRYAWPTNLSASSTVGSYQPGVALGTFPSTSNTPVTIAQASFSSGSATQAGLQYSEVGSFTMLASATSFLGTSGADISGSLVIGRFRPDHFAVTPTSVTPACGTFTYLGQDGFSTNFTITAQNAANATTQNYTGTYTKLGLTTWGNFVFTTSGLPAGAALAASATAPTGSWSNGAASVVAKHQISRSTALAGPVSAVISALPVDSDGVTLSAATPVNAATTLYFGRIRMQNASGSELLALPVPMTAEFYSGTAWTQNASDGCTSLGVPTLSNPTRTMTVAATTPSVANAPLVKGNAGLKLSAPGSGKTGSITLTETVPAYLQFNWTGGATFTQNPSAIATFGTSKSNFIFMREGY